MMHGLDTRMWGDGGAFYDCSFIVTQLHPAARRQRLPQVDNFQNQIDVCRTNTAPEHGVPRLRRRPGQAHHRERDRRRRVRRRPDCREVCARRTCTSAAT